MNVIYYIIFREFITRIRKRSFILISILGPFAFALIAFLPSYLSQQKSDNEKQYGIIDDFGSLTKKFESENLNFVQLDLSDKTNIEKVLNEKKYSGVLYISKRADTINFFSYLTPSITFLNSIEKTIEGVLVEEEFGKYGINDPFSTINTIKKQIKINVLQANNSQQELNDPRFKNSLSVLLGLIIYFYIFMFSSMVLKGVLEEKLNRVIELIITSVSPVRFISGKIIGIALVAITQLTIWITLGYLMVYIFTGGTNVDSLDINQSAFGKTIDPELIIAMANNLAQFQFHIIIPAFFFFFISGYLLYSAIYASIGAIVNHNDEVQQLSTIVTLPLIAAIIILTSTTNNPDSDLSYWFSMIPFTSPVVMMGRIVHGVPTSQIITSSVILLLTILIITWFSGKIYHKAILQVGKKHTFKDLISWFNI